MKKKWLILVCLLSAIIVATYGFMQYRDAQSEKEMREVINWQQMPEFIQAVKKFKNNNQLVDIKQYPFLLDKGFSIAGVDHENCVYISKKGHIADVIYYCEDKKTNFNREQNSTILKKQLSDHWFWCKYYM